MIRPEYMSDTYQIPYWTRYPEEKPEQYFFPDAVDQDRLTTEQTARAEEFKHRLTEDTASQSDQFFDWIVRRAWKHGIINCGTPRNIDMVSLRYSGNDPVVVRRLFDSFTRCYIPGFVIDDANEKPVDYLVKIYCGLSDKNGLCITGPVGSGKTLLIRAWLKFRQNIIQDYVNINKSGTRQRERNHCYYTAIQLIHLFEKHGFELFTVRHGDVLVMDDVRDMVEATRYGNRVNMVEQMIFARYDQFKVIPNTETYITGNLTWKQIEELIGPRASSRLEELTEWNSGLLVTGDRRKKDHVVEWMDMKEFDAMSRKTAYESAYYQELND
jgi:DNA replication protein DnaC